MDILLFVTVKLTCLDLQYFQQSFIGRCMLNDLGKLAARTVKIKSWESYVSAAPKLISAYQQKGILRQALCCIEYGLWAHQNMA